MALISSASSSFIRRWKYDVFLSYRGENTRCNFTDHLYNALRQKGIYTFRDDEKLDRGTIIMTELLKAIEESRFAVVILSRDYASSRWCLIELTKIVECMEKRGLVILPVFYRVDPSDVRNQRGSFGRHLSEHEERLKDNIGNVQMWKAALTKVANLAGWDLENNKPESVVIHKITERIIRELHREFSSVHEDLVGMDSCVEEMLDSYLGEGLDGVRFVGICGMGGIGKTTLALEIYKRISNNFEACSFIVNVREETKNQGVVSLQKQLISKILMESEMNIWNVHEGINVIGNRLRDKKVFIVLDDVDGIEQLEALAGKHDWFGLGSRIIVTSRDRHLLIRWGVNDIYTAKRLNNDDASQLFSWGAFNNPYPEENYVDLTQDFVNYAKGLPLALKVLGSSLFAKTTDEWKSSLDKLKVEPDRNILDILQISFDGLTDTQKELFLDIACFFKGENKDCIRDILESFCYFPEYNIGVLVDKSLITIGERETLCMHDLLQEMGQEIVRHGSPKELGGRSRLWIYEDALHVLKNNTGTEAIEGIMLNTPIQTVEHLSAEAFSKMKKLRLLRIGNVQLPKDLIRGKVQLPQDLSFISNELRVIEWHGYHLKSIPSNFQPNKLVELRMPCSGIEQLWKGIMVLNELKLIDLSDSQNLIETPNFSEVPNLKQLILQRCTRLSKIHASLGNLKWLIRLDLNGCKCLKSLPHKFNLESLEVCILSGCSKLKKFPEIMGNMSHLSELYLDRTAIKDLPIEHLTGLIKLDLRDCKNLSKFSNASCNFLSLKTLSLSGCSKIDELPKNLGNIEGLEELDVSRTAIKSLPSSMIFLKNLRKLSLQQCEGLSSFPLMPRRCLDPMSMLEHTSMGLWSLTHLDLSYCNLQAIPDVFGCLLSLTNLNLIGNSFVALPESIVLLSNLTNLCLSGCTSLQSLPELPLNMIYIVAKGCTSLETLPLRGKDSFKPRLYLFNCVKLVDNQGSDYMLLTMLRRYFQDHLNFVSSGQGRCSSSENCVIIPGSEIPKWISHQSAGASMNLQGPSDFMGIAVCAVFVLRKHHPLHQIYSKNSRPYSHTHELQCCCEVNEYPNDSSLFLSEEFGKMDSHHLWLKYFPYKKFDEHWENKLSQIDANELSQIKITFETEGPGLEVTKCGACLVYKRDIEDLNQTMLGCSITPYEVDLEDSAKDTKIKQSRDDFKGDKASNDVEAPHPKRIQLRLPILIERLMMCFAIWIGNLCTQEQGESDCEEEEEESQ